MKHYYSFLFLLSFFASAEVFAQINIGTSIPPITFLVEKIGGSTVKVETALGPGQNPHTFSITPKKMSSLMQSDLYFSIGFPLEARIVNVLKSKTGSKNGAVKIRDISKGIKRLPLLDDHHHHHAGEEHHDELETMGDTHIWTTPQNLRMMATVIAEELKNHAPQLAPTFEQNFQLLLREIDQTQAQLDKLLMPLRGKSVLIYHPSIQYLTAQYGIELLPVEIDGKEPSPKQLNKIVAKARSHHAKSILIDAYLDGRHIKSIIQLLNVKEIKLELLNHQILESIIKAAQAIAATEGNNAAN